jgi:ankyrin repeat protein
LLQGLVCRVAVNCVSEMLSEEGLTALHHAACRGHTSVVQQLLDADATVHAGDAKRWTAIHFADCKLQY